MPLHTLREKHTQLVNQANAILDAKGDQLWTKEDQASFDGVMDQVDSAKGQINAYIRKQEADVEESFSDAKKFDIKDSKISAEKKRLELFLRKSFNEMSNEERIEIRNTMSTATAGQGGYTVQSEVATQLVDSLKAYGGVRTVAQIIRTAQGNPLSFPTSDGTAETGELIGENTTATALDPSFGTVPVNTYKFSSKIVAVPYELLQDSMLDIGAFITNRLTTRLGRITNSYQTTGTGTAQPGGIVTGATAGKVGTTGQTLTVIVDDLIDLVHSVDPAYRVAVPGEGADVGFMMNDASLKIIRKLKDSTGRPIFIPGYDGLGVRMPDTLLGYPIVINQDMAVMAANAKSILFGDLSSYVVRDVMDASLFRFDDSAYAKLGQVGFLMWMRSGGNLLDTVAIKYYQNSAT